MNCQLPQPQNNILDDRHLTTSRPQIIQRPRFNVRRSTSAQLRLLACLCVLASAALDCGAFYPSRLLDGSDEPLFTAPTARFREEIGRLPAAKTEWTAKPPTDQQSHANQTTEADLKDLQTALQRGGVRQERIEEIVGQHAAERSKAQVFFEALAEARERVENDPDAAAPDSPQPEAPKVTAGLPDEFADYFRGWLAFKSGKLDEAEKNWRTLLDRPAKERPFKSTWAAFMLGKLKLQTNPREAVDEFQLLRSLVKEGFADSLGLAASSLGWEAKAHAKEKRFGRALKLYLEQLATGDESALSSLRWTAAAALKDGGQPLAELAFDPTLRRVVSAYLISRPVRSRYYGTPSSGSPEETTRWLEAVEQAKAKDVDLADQLALAAYQAGEMELAQRWIGRAGKSPVAEWLWAKLLMRAGKVAEAAKMLSGLATQFPSLPRTTNDPPAVRLAETIGFDESYDPSSQPGKRLQGELGILKLTRGDYAGALEALIEGGLWPDAAYVAERVLTVDELKSHVDRHWPEADAERLEALRNPPEDLSEAEELKRQEALRVEETRRQLRSLLGRRLTRGSRGSEARSYFPEELRPLHDALLRGLLGGEDESLPASERAAHWWQAAQILRTNGMELIATQADPDWAGYGANFELEGAASIREASEALKVFAASAQELGRMRASAADPDVRFHYRYQAAFIAMDAARMMPDNHDETARVLHTAGCWLKDQDPQTADIFYKALVRRCRRTELGRVADLNRWFPELDDDGKPIERVRRPKPVEPPPEEPAEALPLPEETQQTDSQ